MSNDGTYTAITAGSTTVTITVNGNSASIVVTVMPIQIKITAPKTLQVEAGTVMVLPCSVFPDLGFPVTYDSDDPAIGTVSSDGTFTAITPGTTNVTVTVNDNSATIVVTVTEAFVRATSFAIPDVWVVAKLTNQATLANLTPANADLDLTWSIGNTIYASVDAAGIVTGNAVGETTITVTDSISGLSATAAVYSRYPVTAVTFAENLYTVLPEQTLQLIANVTMRTQSCENHLVSFASSDDSIATVDPENGLVQGISDGIVFITATAVNDSDIAATCAVMVGQPSILSLPTSLTTIESEAFTGLPSVDAIRIPANVTSIASDAFDPDMVLLVPANSQWVQWATDYGYTPIEE